MVWLGSISLFTTPLITTWEYPNFSTCLPTSCLCIKAWLWCLEQLRVLIRVNKSVDCTYHTFQCYFLRGPGPSSSWRDTSMGLSLQWKSSHYGKSVYHHNRYPLQSNVTLDCTHHCNTVYISAYLQADYSANYQLRTAYTNKWRPLGWWGWLKPCREGQDLQHVHANPFILRGWVLLKISDQQPQGSKGGLQLSKSQLVYSLYKWYRGI